MDSHPGRGLFCREVMKELGSFAFLEAFRKTQSSSFQKMRPRKKSCNGINCKGLHFRVVMPPKSSKNRPLRCSKSKCLVVGSNKNRYWRHHQQHRVTPAITNGLQQAASSSIAYADQRTWGCGVRLGLRSGGICAIQWIDRPRVIIPTGLPKCSLTECGFSFDHD